MSANREPPGLWARALASLRLVAFYAFSALFIPVIVVTALLKPGEYLYYRLVRAWVAAALAIFGVRIESTGADGLVSGKDYVLLVNHRSHFDRTVDALSFGQRKRVCIAGVLAMKPEILVLDEPTCGLDPAGVTSLMNLMKDLNGRRGITIIMATNTVDLVTVYMDRLAILYHGNILTAGTPEYVFSHPEAVRHACLELPQIAQLMQILRDEDSLLMDTLPLTVGEARRFLAHKLKSNHSGIARSLIE